LKIQVQESAIYSFFRSLTLS